MDTLSKLAILADAAKYDAACTSSGVSRAPKAGMLGCTSAAGCCHSFTADGRCITLLKVLMSNACSYDCAYCTNRRGESRPRATFSPRELADLTVDFYKRNYIEGLFLSSGVLGTPDETTERMIECLSILREELRFNGYVHSKVIPGTSAELIDRLGCLSDRLSVNLELPSAASLSLLCPEKSARDVTAPMAHIHEGRTREELLLSKGKKPAIGHRDSGVSFRTNASTLTLRNRSTVASGRRSFAPAGQSTQIIVGATPEDDNHILQLSSALYRKFDLKRVFFSAYVPVVSDDVLPASDTPVPLRREHRLYQADWLMRYYDFPADELATPDKPWLDLDVDPKLAWALSNLERFPVEANEAPLEELLRVPGIGPVGARRITTARRAHPLTFDDLKVMNVTLKRARHFLTCSGKRDQDCPLDPDLIRQRVVSDARATSYNSTRRMAEGQLSLF